MSQMAMICSASSWVNVALGSERCCLGSIIPAAGLNSTRRCLAHQEKNTRIATERFSWVVTDNGIPSVCAASETWRW